MKIIRKNAFLIILLMSCMIKMSCSRDNEPTITDNSQNNQGENNSEESKPDNSTNYYFRVETQVGNIRPEAGKLDISFDCNQPWSVSYNGDISGFSYTPNKGNGKGVIFITYDEVKYKETSTEISWNESGTLTFHIREGNPENFRNSTYNVYISRKGSKKKV